VINEVSELEWVVMEVEVTVLVWEEGEEDAVVLAVVYEEVAVPVLVWEEGEEDAVVLAVV
jgi:hypothetical protein